MLKNAFRTITLKGVSLFLYLNLARVFVVFIALYFSALFIFNTEKSRFEILQEWPFHYIILASLLSIAAGYIIHHFYEEELLKIQKPFQAYFKQFLSKKEYLRLYITLNVISLSLAAMVSWKIFLFFLIYQFLIWFYAHKMSSKLWLANLSKTVLTLLPFLALMYYFQNFSYKVICFGVLLFVLILLKEMLKDFITIQTDTLFEHESLPNTIGERQSLPILLFLFGFAIFLNIFLANYYQLGIMELYLYSSALVYAAMIGLLLSKFPKRYNWALMALKAWIFVGVLSIPFINWNLGRVMETIDLGFLSYI